ncbi:MAG: hypothetical protein QGF68_13595, partial [Nitrospinota bacterium]|nr:hypothetical protein [Nitrospinota bacterium]
MRRTVVLSGILAAAAVWAMAPEAFAQKKVFGLVTLREPVAITVGQLGKPVATKKVTPNTLHWDCSGRSKRAGNSSVWWTASARGRG